MFQASSNLVKAVTQSSSQLFSQQQLSSGVWGFDQFGTGLSLLCVPKGQFDGYVQFEGFLSAHVHTQSFHYKEDFSLLGFLFLKRFSPG